MDCAVAYRTGRHPSLPPDGDHEEPLGASSFGNDDAGRARGVVRCVGGSFRLSSPGNLRTTSWPRRVLPWSGGDASGLPTGWGHPQRRHRTFLKISSQSPSVAA